VIVTAYFRPNRAPVMEWDPWRRKRPNGPIRVRAGRFPSRWPRGRGRRTPGQARLSGL